MFWLKMNITSSKDVNIGKLNFTSPLLKVRLSKSGFEASGPRISGRGGNTWICALDLSVHHTCLREVNLARPQFAHLENEIVGVDGPSQLSGSVLTDSARRAAHGVLSMCHNVSSMDESSLGFHFLPGQF